MINSETDLRIFIDENKTNNEFITKVEYKPYEFSKEI
jgi:DNA-dependent RNA polymerase auxiliary subunit epsilon